MAYDQTHIANMAKAKRQCTVIQPLYLLFGFLQKQQYEAASRLINTVPFYGYDYGSRKIWSTTGQLLRTSLVLNLHTSCFGSQDGFKFHNFGFVGGCNFFFTNGLCD